MELKEYSNGMINIGSYKEIQGLNFVKLKDAGH